MAKNSCDQNKSLYCIEKNLCLIKTKRTKYIKINTEQTDYSLNETYKSNLFKINKLSIIYETQVFVEYMKCLCKQRELKYVFNNEKICKLVIIFGTI